MATVSADVRKPQADADQITPLVILAVMVAELIYAYLNTLLRAADFWENPKYSHGYLIPVFSLVLLFMRYEPFGKVKLSERLIGLGLLCAGLAMRLTFTYLPNITPEMYSFVPSIIGIFTMVGGLNMLRWAGPPLGFLIFMFPLPGFLDIKLLKPLQNLATQASTFCLQTLGISSFAEGNTIHIGELQLGVVEQCSGLRMLTIFVALAVAITLVTNRPWWERIVIVVSAVPIALAVNIIRITVTGVLHLQVGQEIADKVFHDLAGWVMMPMALGFLYVEFQVLSHLVIDESITGPSPMLIGGARSAPRAGKQPTGLAPGMPRTAAARNNPAKPGGASPAKPGTAPTTKPSTVQPIAPDAVQA